MLLLVAKRASAGNRKIYTLIRTNAALLDFRQSYSLKEARCHFSLWYPSNLQLDPDQQFCCNEWSKRNEFSLYKFIEAFRECFTTSKLFLIRLGNITYTRNNTHKLTQHF